MGRQRRQPDELAAGHHPVGGFLSDLVKYNPDQPRGSHGEWSAGGDSGPGDGKPSSGGGKTDPHPSGAGTITHAQFLSFFGKPSKKAAAKHKKAAARHRKAAKVSRRKATRAKTAKVRVKHLRAAKQHSALARAHGTAAKQVSRMVTPTARTGDRMAPPANI